ncbi:MAG: hypothetical protein QHH14_08825 [Clostridiales bacterium]|nr:hypothetical protein [Clostridiales bacterium]
MKKTGRTGFWIILPAFVAILFSGVNGADFSVGEILKKNIEASGGGQKLGQVQNFSFRTGSTRAVVLASGELKLTSGKEPVVTEVILVKGDQVQRNSYNTITEITDPQKTVYQTLARLYAGLFSLKNFEDKLKLEGIKTYGVEKLYHLTLTKTGAVEVDFFLRTDDFTLKRLVFQGLTPEGEKYEVNYDFAPFEETKGVRIPLSWFSSQVGARGSLAEAAEVAINQPLTEDFFSRLEVNIGTAEVAAGVLQGNVIDSRSSPFGLTIITNWTLTDVGKAGLKTGDRLTFLVNGIESELIFYASAQEMPDQNELAKGARLMTIPPRGGETYVIQFVGVDTKDIAARLKPLAAIELRKK